MHEHGFNDMINNYGSTNINDNDKEDCDNQKMRDDDIDDDISKVINPNVPVKNGYTTTHLNCTECTRLITDQGALSIMNNGLDCIKEELYQYQYKKM